MLLAAGFCSDDIDDDDLVVVADKPDAVLALVLVARVAAFGSSSTLIPIPVTELGTEDTGVSFTGFICAWPFVFLFDKEIRFLAKSPADDFGDADVDVDVDAVMIPIPLSVVEALGLWFVFFMSAV